MASPEDRIINMKIFILLLLTVMPAEAMLATRIVAKAKGAALKSVSAFPSSNTAILEQGATIDNPTRAYASDGSYVTQGLGATSFGDGLAGTINYKGFGFAIPAGATIVGVVAEWRKYSGDPSNTYDTYVKIVKAGTATGDNKTSFVTWPASPTTLSFGAYNSLWGTTLSPTDVNNIGFGLQIGWVYTNLGVNPVPYIDFVKLTVYYTE